MSEENLPTVKKRPDFADDETRKLQIYIDNGLPGITKVSQNDIETMRRMYLDGMMDYKRIAKDCRIKLEQVLFFAHRENWYEEKMDRISSVLRSLENHTMVRADGIVFLQEVISNLQNYYREKMREIYQTGDTVKIMESMQMRHLEKYAKMLSLFENMVSKAKESKDEPPGPLVNLNVSGDATVTHNADGSINVSQGEQAHSSEDIKNILKTLADMKRVQEQIDESAKNHKNKK